MQPAMKQYFQMLQLQQPAWMYSLMAFSHFAKETAKVHFWRMTLPLFIYSRYFLFIFKGQSWCLSEFQVNRNENFGNQYDVIWKNQVLKMLHNAKKPGNSGHFEESIFTTHVLLKSLYCSVFSDWISGPKGQTNSWNWKQNGTLCLRPSIWKVLAYLRSQNPLHSFSTIVQLWCLPLVTVLFT